MGNFSPRKTFFTGADNATSIDAFDIDGDGDQDLLATWGYIGDFHQKVAWFKNMDGQGNFSGPIIISDSNLKRPESASAADIDGDGDLDVVSASAFYGGNDTPFYESGWFENLDGQGNFGGMHLIDSAPIIPQTIELFDLDEDNDMDLIIGAAESNTHLVFYENKNGDFGDLIVLDSLPNSPSEIQFVKLNSDNHLDVLTFTDSDDGIIWYEKENESADLGARKIISKSDFRSSFIEEVDWDKDGDSDILATAVRKIGWYENIDGNGEFSTLHVLLEGVVGLNGKSKLADFNGDGELDVIISYFVNGWGTYFSWHENLGDFKELGPRQGLAVFDFYEIVDYDMDGDLDIIYADNNISDKIGWIENVDGLGNLVDLGALFYVNSSEIEAFHLSDVDADGDLDIIYSDQSKTFWRRRLDDGTLSSAMIIDNTTKYILAWNDIDGDGLLDLFTRNNGIIHHKYNSTLGNFEQVADYNTNIWSIDFADVDNDGDLDMVSIPSVDGHMEWLENIDGNGTFSTATDRSTNKVQTNGRGFAADLNADGLLGASL